MSWCTVQDGKIVIRAPYDASKLSALRHLPYSRWDAKKREWTCAATQKAGHDVAELYGQESDQDVWGLWARWDYSQRLRSQDHAIPGDLRTEPQHWDHQRRAFWFSADAYATMLAMEMSCGKSRVTVDLMRWWNCRSVLVICPKAVIPVWPDEAAKFSVDEWIVTATSKAPVKKKVEEADTRFACGGRQMLVVNYESAWRDPFASWILGRYWDLVVLDESHRVKAPGGKASRFCAKLTFSSERRLGLTGTPCPHSPLDAYSQYRFLEPGIFGTSFARFRSRYAVTDQMFPSRVVQWINQDELAEQMATIMFRAKTEDVLDLPEAVDTRVPVYLGANAARVYRELEDELVAHVDEGDVFVSNALSKLLRLQQVTGGCLPVDGRDVQVGTEKEDVLVDLVEDMPRRDPVVVFCRFHHDLDCVRMVASRLDRAYGELSGRRSDMHGRYMPPHMGGDEGYVFGVQVQSGSLGVDFTRAHRAVFYSLGFSLGEYDQVRRRLVRQGQMRSVSFHHIVARGTVDEKVYAALAQKRDVVEYVLEGYRR